MSNQARERSTNASEKNSSHIVSHSRIMKNYIQTIQQPKRSAKNWISVHLSIQRGRRGPRNAGLSSQPLTPSKMLAFPGKSVNKSADIPFINLAILFNVSYVNVFTD